MNQEATTHNDSNGKRYNDKLNVYDASIERIEFIFKTFSRIYISFSGGKDSWYYLLVIKK